LIWCWNWNFLIINKFPQQWNKVLIKLMSSICLKGEFDIQYKQNWKQILTISLNLNNLCTIHAPKKWMWDILTCSHLIRFFSNSKTWNCNKFSSNALQLQCFQQFIAKVSLNVSFSLNHYSHVRNSFNDILNFGLFNFETCFAFMIQIWINKELFLKHTDYNVCLSSEIILTSYLRHQNVKKREFHG
jgi:hypothetical protein